MNILGVELSPSKSHVSKTHYEFAKRWIRLDGEVSPIPLSGISDNISHIGSIFQIFYELFRNRQLLHLNGTFLDFFSDFYFLLGKSKFSKEEISKFGYNPFKGLPFMVKKRILERVRPHYIFLQIRDGSVTNQELRNYIGEIFHKADKNFEFPLPPSRQGIIELINNQVYTILKRMLDKADEEDFHLESQLRTSGV